MAVALNSRLEPLVCLKWSTERPYAGGSRLSPDFDLLRKKWHLEMKLTKDCYDRKRTCCEILLHSRNSIKPSRDCVAVDCHLKISDKSYQSSASSATISDTDCYNLMTIFKVNIDGDQISPSGSVEEWKVFCLFSGGVAYTEYGPRDCVSFSLQVGNKTINMSVHDQNKPTESVDECIQVSQEVPRDIEALSTDISGMFEEGILPDFKLQCQDQVFEVHRSVLAARSEVFRAMLRSGMRESETGSADIEDIEAPVLQILLKFLYSGKLSDLSEDTAFKVYEASDKYAVRSLLAACSYRLIRYLTVDNCIKYLSTADSHSDEGLKAAAVSFIVAHPGVFNSAAWLTFLKEHRVSASEVLQTYVASSSQQFGDLSPKRFKKSD